MGIDAQMYVTGVIPTQEQADEIAYDLAEAFGHGRFWIWDADGFSKDSRAVILHEPKTDDPDYEWETVREKGYQVRIATRYYGPGYERGDLPFILAVTHWLRWRLPNCVVWYGGDESVDVLGANREQEVWDHFCKVGHKPYQTYFGTGSECCGHPMISYMFGASTGYRCPGCGMREIHRNGELIRTRSEREVSEFLQRGRVG